MSTIFLLRKTSESVEDLHIGTWGYEESKSKSLKNYYLMKFQLKLVISSKRQITSNRMKSLISDWSPISKLLRNFSLSPKTRKLKNVLSKCQIPSNCMKSLISDCFANFVAFSEYMNMLYLLLMNKVRVRVRLSKTRGACEGACEIFFKVWLCMRRTRKFLATQHLLSMA